MSARVRRGRKSVVNSIPPTQEPLNALSRRRRKSMSRFWAQDNINDSTKVQIGERGSDKFVIYRGKPDISLRTRKRYIVCSPERFVRCVSTLTDVQKEGIRCLGFRTIVNTKWGRLRRSLCWKLVHDWNLVTSTLSISRVEIHISENSFMEIMGIGGKGSAICLEGCESDIADLRNSFHCTPSGIRLAYLVDMMQKTTLADDDFFRTFILFALGTLLCPTSTTYVKASYLHFVKDVSIISELNWSQFCFLTLRESVMKYKKSKSCNISGCLLFLQIFYVHHASTRLALVDRSIPPIIVWDDAKIRRCLLWIRKERGRHTVMDQMRNVVNSTSTICNTERKLRDIEDTVNSILSLQAICHESTQVLLQKLEHFISTLANN